MMVVYATPEKYDTLTRVRWVKKQQNNKVKYYTKHQK